MGTLEGTGWSALPNWGSDGWDAGAWPLIVLAVARTRDEQANSPLTTSLCSSFCVVRSPAAPSRQ